jgi:uncharacterized glyoxalase superfamily protein PhnB
MAKRKTRRAARAARPARPGRSRSARRTASAAAPRNTSAIRRRKPENLRLRAIEPALTVDNLEQSLKYYTDVLGFFLAERYTDKNGVVRGAMLKAGAVGIGLSQDDFSKGRDRKKGLGMSLWLQTAQDIDAHAARITAAGGRLVQGPTTEEWGGRSLTVDDPDGFRLRIYSQP